MTDSPNKPEPRTRRTILDRLKQDGPRDAGALAADLGISAMAVRQHLYALQAESVVAFEEEPRPLGRPAKIWRLTPAADRFFPDGHAELALDLLDALRTAFGAEGLDRLLAARSAAQAADYKTRVKPGDSLETQLAALAAVRTEEGYMAEVAGDGEDGYLLVENHCPVCAAPRTCQGLCASELNVFQEVLGDDVAVERVDHIMAGARRCAYRITGQPAVGGKGRAAD